MASYNQHQKYLDKILESKEFRSSQIYQNLLIYLYDCFCEKKSVKEVTIAIDFFNKSASFNPAEESTIRFHMYKLRKKLAAYYANDGQADAFKIEIPKGHYDLLFVEQGIRRKRRALTVLEKILISISSLLIGAFILVLIIFLGKQTIPEPIPPSSPIWAPFFNKDLPVNLIFGDFYIFEEFDSTRANYRRVMDYHVTTDRQFYEYENNYPDRATNWFEIGEIPHNSIFNLKSLVHVFYSFDTDYEIKLTRNMTADDIMHHNNIYVGNFINMRIMRDLVTLLPAHVHPFTDHKRTIDIYSTQADSFFTFQSETLWLPDSYKLDFGIFARLPGINDEEFIIMTGFSYISLVHFTTMTSERDKLQKMIDDLLDFTNLEKLPPYFSAVYEIAGYGYSDYTSKLKLFNVIKKNEFQDAYRRLISKTEN